MTTKKSHSPIGVDDGDLGAIKPKHLKDNEPLAITVLSYNKSLEAKIKELETENETLKTYPQNYEIGKIKARVSAGLNLLGTLFVGVGAHRIELWTFPPRRDALPLLRTMLLFN